MIQIDDHFYAEIQELPSQEKLKIVEFLLMDLDKPDPEIDKIWAEEAEKRLSAYKAGKIKSYSLKEVFG
jgi:putative addiction module component (TIGR02574 family)